MEVLESKLAEILEVEKVEDNQLLESFECWDSLTILSIIAITDSIYGVTLTANEIIGAKSIGGLKDVVSQKRK